MASSTNLELLLIIRDEIYEVTKFIPHHPGEGIHDVYIKHYNRKEVTQEFEHYHFDDQPEEWLAAAKEKKFDSETGIAYVCQSCFKAKTTKIPVWFHYFRNDTLGVNYIKTVSPTKENAFIVVPDVDSQKN